MTTLTRAIKSLLRNDSVLKCAAASSNAKQHYTSLQDYVYHIKNGNFEGVDPSVIDTCPVCTGVYQNMTARPQPATTITNEPLNEINPQFWIALWILYHDSAAYEDNYYHDDQYA